MARPLSEEARQKAVDATVDLLAEDGIDGFSIDAVVRRSGVAKTTLYRHWSSGSDLLVHALGCRIEPVPAPDTGSLAGDLTELYRTLRAIGNRAGNRQLFLDMMAAAARDPEFQGIHRAIVRERAKPTRTMIERAIERGEIPPVDIDAAVQLIEGPFITRVLKDGEPVAEAEIEALVPLVARGLGVADI